MKKKKPRRTKKEEYKRDGKKVRVRPHLRKVKGRKAKKRIAGHLSKRPKKKRK